MPSLSWRLGVYLVIILLGATVMPIAQAEGRTGFGVNSTAQGFLDDAKAAKELGLSVMRLPLPWQMVEPRPGRFDWRRVDRIVATAQKNRMELLFVLRSISLWGTREQPVRTAIYHSSSPPKDLAQWLRFLQALAARYQGGGVHYGIENEVAGKAFWRGTLEEYLQLLQASYHAIKQADPKALVLPSAMGSGIVRHFESKAAIQTAFDWHDQWLRAILATKAFDVVDVHNYYFPGDRVVNGWTFRSYLEHIHRLMRQAGVQDRPIWITEAGYVSMPTSTSGRVDPGSPERQAAWLREAYQQAIAAGVQRIFWLLIRDRREPYFGSMGLLDGSGRPRPAWRALQQWAREPRPPS